MTDAFPLKWPQGRPRTKPGNRKPGRFNRKEQVKSSYSDLYYQSSRPITVAVSIERLQEELDRLGARYPVVSSNLELRLDGLPRSGQREPEDPGVAVYFDLNGKPHCLPCDTYQTVAANIAAIAAHMGATRSIERHGVASVAEMFSGFAALPAPKGAAWWEVLQVKSDADKAAIEAAFKRIAKTRHPDRGGSDILMAELNAAREQALTGEG